MFLAIEALRAVRETEANTVEMRRNARVKARQIREKAEADGEALIKKAISEAQQEAQNIIVRAEAEAAQEAEPIHQEAEAASAQIRKQAKGRLPDAVSLIVERIVKANGCS